MIGISFNLSGDIFNKSIDVDIPLTKISSEVKKTVEDNLKAPRSYDGSTLTPLKDGYYKKKKQKSGKAIFDGFRKGKSKLFNSVISKKISLSEYNVTIEGNNKYIMYYLQTGAGNMAGKRKGFGINDNDVSNILNKNKAKIIFK